MVLGMLPVAAFATGVTLSSIAASPAEVAAGEKSTITPTFSGTSDTNFSVYWIANDANVFTIAADSGVTSGTTTSGIYTIGKDAAAHKVTVTPKAGTAAQTSGTITAKLNESDNGVTCTVTVKAATSATVPVESVTLDKASVMIMEGGDTATVTATVTPDNAADKTLTVKSSDEKVATAALGTDGKTITITGKEPGNATVTVTAANGKSATVKVTVEEFSICNLDITPKSGIITEWCPNLKISSKTPNLKEIRWTLTKDGKVVTEGTSSPIHWDETAGESRLIVKPQFPSNGTYTFKAVAVKEWDGKTYERESEVTYTVNTQIVVKEETETVEAKAEDLGATEEQAKAANDAAKDTKVEVDSAVLDAITKDEGYQAVEAEAKKYDNEEGQKALVAEVEKLPEEDKKFVTDENRDKLTVVVQIVVKTEPKKYDGQTFTLDISPVARLVATVADKSQGEIIKTSGNDKNAAVLKEEKVEAKAAEAIEVTITIPTGILKENSTLAWIRHKLDNGTEKLHKAIKGDNGFTFTNKWGFSEFTVEGTAPYVAVIENDPEEKGYDSLQAAVNNAKSGDTILILDKDADLTAKVTHLYGKVELTIKPDGGYVADSEALTVTLTDRNGKNAAVSGTKYTIADNGSAPSGGGGGGGGSSSSSSSVKTNSATGGKVTLSSSSAAQGDKVTLTVKPDAGYELSSVTVKDNSGKTVTLTQVGENQFTFIMPAGAVTVTPVFVKSIAPAVSFSDVPSGAYYYDAVQWAIEKGITNGTGADTFSPNAACTRAQMVTFLWRAAGCPEPRSASNPFADVPAGQYYTKAVLWAAEQGITSGTSAGAFSPDDTVTRGQTVTFLYRYAGSPAVSASGSFSDVSSGEYYAPAVQWALGRGVTNGTSATTFSPSDDCVRAQIVTFLYRASN